MIISSSNFVTSASKLSECPTSDTKEFAFIGRSNVGKSSLINMLTQRKGLAKVSVTPGKTELLNFFIINNERHLVDLPWYGYAKRSKTQRDAREKRMREYFVQRPQLKNIFVLVDGSILPQHIDLLFIDTLNAHNIPFDIIVTKIDKSTQKDLHRNTKILTSEIKKITNTLPKIFLVSNTKQKGKEEILNHIDTLLHI